MHSGCPFHEISYIKEFDALDTKARENPWPYYDWLSAASEPIYKVPHEEGFYMVHRYEDVKSIFSDTENFSNKIIPTIKSPFLALMDGAEHARIREVVAEIFSPKNLSAIEAAIRSAIITATDKLFQNRPVELFDTWANILPLSTLSLVFGLDTSPSAILKLHHDSIAINKALFVTGGTGPRRNNRPDTLEKLKISWALIKHSGKIIRLASLLGKKGMTELLKMIRPENHNLVVPRPN